MSSEVQAALWGAALGAILAFLGSFLVEFRRSRMKIKLVRELLSRLRSDWESAEGHSRGQSTQVAAYADLEQSFGTLRTLVFSSEEATLINEFIVISQNISRIRSHFANGHLGLIHWHVEAIRESFRKMFPPTGPPARNDLKTLESYIYKIIVAGVAAAGVGSASSIQDTKILHTVLVGVSLMTVSRWAVILYQKRVATALKERALILAGGLLTLIGLISLIRNGFFEQDVSNSQAALTIAAIIGLFGLPDALRIYVANEVDVKLHHDNQIVRQCLEVAPTAGVIVGFLIGKFWI